VREFNAYGIVSGGHVAMAFWRWVYLCAGMRPGTVLRACIISHPAHVR
jgi:hypothetical protein